MNALTVFEITAIFVALAILFGALLWAVSEFTERFIEPYQEWWVIGAVVSLGIMTLIGAVQGAGRLL